MGICENPPCRCLCCPGLHRSHQAQRMEQVCSCWRNRAGIRPSEHTWYKNLKMSIAAIFPGVWPVDGEQKSQSRHSLLSSWQVIHWPETLPRSYTVIVDAIQVRLLWVLWSKKSLQINNHRILTAALEQSTPPAVCVQDWYSHLSTAVPWQGFVDFINVVGYGLKAGMEAIKSLFLYLLKCLLSLLSSLPCSFKFWKSKRALRNTDHNNITSTSLRQEQDLAVWICKFHLQELFLFTDVPKGPVRRE